MLERFLTLWVSSPALLPPRSFSLRWTSHMNTHTREGLSLAVDISLSSHLRDSSYLCHAHITSPGNTAGRHFPSQAGSPCVFVESDILLEGLPASGVVPSCSSLWRCQWRSDITTFSLSFSLVNQTEGRRALTSLVEWNVVSQGLLVVSTPWFFFSCQIDISTDRYWLWEIDMSAWRWTLRKEMCFLILTWW